jgi:hypothetical protein
VKSDAQLCGQGHRPRIEKQRLVPLTTLRYNCRECGELPVTVVSPEQWPVQHAGYIAWCWHANEGFVPTDEVRPADGLFPGSIPHMCRAWPLAAGQRITE